MEDIELGGEDNSREKREPVKHIRHVVYKVKQVEEDTTTDDYGKQTKPKYCIANIL